jgi:hypothetical protein
VRQIVSTLSDTLRFPVMLCHIEDLSTRDAARLVGITEGALRKRLHDGKKKLQERIVRMAEKSFQVEYCDGAKGGSRMNPEGIRPPWIIPFSTP